MKRYCVVLLVILLITGCTAPQIKEELALSETLDNQSTIESSSTSDPSATSDFTPELTPTPAAETHNHDYQWTSTIEPSIGVEGIITYTCSCGNSYTEIIPALPQPTPVPTPTPSCPVCGNTDHTIHPQEPPVPTPEMTPESIPEATPETSEE